MGGVKDGLGSPVVGRALGRSIRLVTLRAILTLIDISGHWDVEKNYPQVNPDKFFAIVTQTS
jgi:hypothetical protein